MKDEDGELMEAIGRAVLVMAGSVITSILRCWVICKLWAWFVVMWFGAKPLTIPVALGIGAMIMLITFRPKDVRDADEVDYAKEFIVTAVASLMALGFGWVYRQFA